MVLPPFRNSDHVAVSVSIDFFSNSKVDVPFHFKAYDYSCADWDNVCDYLRDVTLRDGEKKLTCGSEKI